VAWSTIPGFQSFRHKELGSWFMQSLCSALNEHGDELELSKIVEKVKKDVKNNSNHLASCCLGNCQYRQIPYIYSTLNKSVFFPK
jgi:caspase-like apoptosis-related cysteine protease